MKSNKIVAILVYEQNVPYSKVTELLPHFVNHETQFNLITEFINILNKNLYGDFLYGILFSSRLQWNIPELKERENLETRVTLS